MGIGRNRVFNISAIEELIRDTRHLMDAAEEVTGELYQEMCELADVLRSLPDDVRDEGLYADVLQMRQNLRTSEFRDYREEMTKNLRRLCSNIASGDRKCGKDFLNTAADFRSITEKIRSLTELIPEGADSGTYEDFKKKFDECTKSWDEVNDSVRRAQNALQSILHGLRALGVCMSADPVNLSTGNFAYEKEDLRIPGRPELRLTRTYNALSKEPGVLGTGFRHSYECNLIIAEEEVVLLAGDGHEEHFMKQSDGRLRSESSRGSLKEESDGYIYTASEESITIFDKEGRQLAWQDAAGNRLTFRYEGKLLHEVVRESDKRKLCFTYDGEGRLVGVEDVSYIYGEGGQLHQVIGTDGAVTAYTYDESGLLKGVTNPLGVTAVENEYDEDGRCIRQYFPDGGSMSYAYDEENSCVELTERNGSKTIYYHDERYHHTKTVYEDGEETYAYNAKGQCVRHKDCNGNITRYSYDGRGNLAQVLYADGMKENATYDSKNHLIRLSINGKEKLHNSYDSNGNLTESRDALGRVTKFLYEGQGESETSNARRQLTRICRPDGSTIQLSCDERGNIRKITDPYGNESYYAYDSDNRIILVTDPRGGKTAYSYDKKGRMVKEVNALGNTTEYQYNSCGKRIAEICEDKKRTGIKYNNLNYPSEIIDAEGKSIKFLYDKMWNISNVVFPNGAEKKYVYDSRNRLIKTVDAKGNCIEYAYDPQGNCVAIKNPQGYETRYEYNMRNKVTRIIDSEGNDTHFVYDDRGFLVERIDALGQAQKYSYDDAGQKIREINALGVVTYFDYSAVGKLEAVRDINGEKIHYEYERGGRLRSIRYRNGQQEKFFYDENGNIKTHEKSDGYIRFYEYDELNQLLKISKKNGIEKKYTYDLSGNIISETDAMGNTTKFEYSPTGNMTKVIDALGNETDYHYDSMGNLLEIRQKGEDTEHITRYRRNILGQVEEITDALGLREYYSYDEIGQMIRKQDKDGFITEYTYTSLGDVNSIHYADGRNVNLKYNPLRKLTEIKDWLGVTHIEMNGLGYTTKIQYPSGEEIAYTYGDNGERTSLVYPDGKTVYYRYNKDLKLSELQDGENIVSYLYNDEGRMTKKSIPNGISSSYFYDEQGRIQELIHEDKKGILDKYTYEYDLLGNKTRVQKQRRELREESGTWSYSYDAISRLIEIKKDNLSWNSYEYDCFGNRIREHGKRGESLYEYNELNQLICRKDIQEENVQKIDYSYDCRGNLIEIAEDGMMRNHYMYGALNRMEEAINQNGERASYQYNGLGFRMGMEIESRNISEVKMISYLLDLTRRYDNLLQKKIDNKVQAYLWAESIVGVTEGEDSAYYLQDELGSTIRLLDTKGDIVETYGYDDFGEDLYQDQGGHQPFGYTGYQRDKVSETYFAQAREYLPRVGRFAAKDADCFIRKRKPITSNLYLYCGVNPLKYVDKTGYDHYIFYLPEWKDEAFDDRKRLADYYDIDKSAIHLLEITNDEELTEGWNAMGTEDGKEVSIETVIINTHARPIRLSYGNEREDKFTSADIKELENKEIDRLILYGCNAGHLDFKDTNPAAEFSKKVDGAPVLASDGTVDSWHKYLCIFGPMQYTSKNDDEFKKWVKEANGTENRDAEGWFVYSWKDGEVHLSESLGKKLVLKDMLKVSPTND